MTDKKKPEWTTTPPTKPGLYLWRRDDKPCQAYRIDEIDLEQPYYRPRSGIGTTVWWYPVPIEEPDR